MNDMKETPNQREPSRVPEFIWHIPFYLFCLACAYTAFRWASRAFGL